MKDQPRKNASLKNILDGISAGSYYVSCLFKNYKRFKLSKMDVSISALDFIDIEKRYQEIKTTIPAKKRGNLSPYAGKKVVIIPTTISQTGKRMSIYIKEI